ncbi:MAG: DUF177 domain-containing protein [Cyclobacteriaceae bacterium]|nr:DUF177 domain-containing protein [Cyclobacteriaceae bacterium]
MGKKEQSLYKIDIQGLAFKEHIFEFEVVSAFFSLFENSPVSVGNCYCKSVLTKTETMISISFEIKGSVELICDRSLKKFNYPILTKNNVIFKYGDEWQELDDELYEIPSNLDQLDVAPFIYEFIILALPMKKLHPDFAENSEIDEVIYSTESEKKEENTLNPMWENLKKLKK